MTRGLLLLSAGSVHLGQPLRVDHCQVFLILTLEETEKCFFEASCLHIVNNPHFECFQPGSLGCSERELLFQLPHVLQESLVTYCCTLLLFTY